MPKFIANINCRIDSYSNCAVARIIHEDCKDKQEFIDYLIKNYPEYFFSGRLYQKITKKAQATDEFIYVTIFELDEYWEKYWLTPVQCEMCGNEVNRVDLINHTLNDNCFWNKTKFCSQECQEKYNTLTRFEDDDAGYHEKNGKEIYIYKITNKQNNMCYIGKTVNHFIFRWWSHLKAETGTKFHKAIESSKPTDWTFEVLEILPIETSNTEVFKAETNYIIEYNSIANGYNTILSYKGE